MTVYNMTKPLADLIKSIDPDKYSINDCQGKENVVLN
jgi:hypothetical protein